MSRTWTILQEGAVDRVQLSVIRKQVRKAARHLGVFENNLPDISADAGAFAQEQIDALSQGLPTIKRLVRYAYGTINSVAKVSDVADEGTAGLKKASDLLLELRRSTEEAANQIFDIFDQVDPLLEQVANDEGIAEESKKCLVEARDRLQHLFSALQFQDIASQQIEGINALLAALSDDLVELSNGDGDSDLFRIDVKDGSFDSRAKFRAPPSPEA
jgi:chemotaxis regulatin CheY-phosphate phosphatase CheZ